MATVKVNGFVISQEDYKESDQLVTLYLFSLGKIKARLRGVRKPTGKLKNAAITLNYGEFLLNKTKSNFYTIISFSQSDSLSAVNDNFKAYYAQLIFIDFLNRTTFFNVENDEVAKVVLNALLVIKHAEKGDVDKYLIFFLLKLLDVAGYKTDFLRSADNGRKLVGNCFKYYPLDSCIANIQSSSVNLNEDLISKRVVEQLKYLQMWELKDLNKIKSDKVETKDILKWFKYFIKVNVELELQSVDMYLTFY